MHGSGQLHSRHAVQHLPLRLPAAKHGDVIPGLLQPQPLQITLDSPGTFPFKPRFCTCNDICRVYPACIGPSMKVDSAGVCALTAYRQLLVLHSHVHHCSCWTCCSSEVIIPEQCIVCAHLNMVWIVSAGKLAGHAGLHVLSAARGNVCDCIISSWALCSRSHSNLCQRQPCSKPGQDCRRCQEATPCP